MDKAGLVPTNTFANPTGSRLLPFYLSKPLQPFKPFQKVENIGPDNYRDEPMSCSPLIPQSGEYRIRTDDPLLAKQVL